MQRLALMVVVVLASAVPATAMAGDSPGTVEQNVVRWNFAGQYGRIWQTLHPAYQKVVSRSFWQACKVASANKTASVDFASLDITDTYADTLTFPVLGRLDVTAVTASMKYKYLGTTHTTADTVYFIRVGGQWKGLWDTATYKAYKAHRCPA
jgi:hypothetical protein